jgi:hypothetical protein
MLFAFFVAVCVCLSFLSGTQRHRGTAALGDALQDLRSNNCLGGVRTHSLIRRPEFRTRGQTTP